MAKKKHRKNKHEDIDYSIQRGDIVVSANWTLSDLIIIDVNWALLAAAVKLGKDGDIIVWPIAGLRRV